MLNFVEIFLQFLQDFWYIHTHFTRKIVSCNDPFIYTFRQKYRPRPVISLAWELWKILLQLARDKDIFDTGTVPVYCIRMKIDIYPTFLNNFRNCFRDSWNIKYQANNYLCCETTSAGSLRGESMLTGVISNAYFIWKNCGKLKDLGDLRWHCLLCSKLELLNRMASR